MDSNEALHNQSQTEASQTEPLAPPVNPFAPDDGRCVTLEEYWDKWYENPYPDIDVSYEWNNGRLEAKPSHNAPQIVLCNWFLDLLRRYIETYPDAKLINLETGFVLTMEDPADPSGQRKAVRKPDIGVILKSNPVSWGGIDQYHFDGVCDMVVEAISDATPAEVLRDTEEKKLDYALAGVKEYYILDPSREHMRFYRLIAGGRYQEIQPNADGVVASTLLPGLQFRMQDLRRQRDLLELALDDVYSGYVIPAYKIAVDSAKAAEQRADAAAARRADAEAQRADAAEQRADAEAAARREADEKMRAMADELDRLRRQSS